MSAIIKPTAAAMKDPAQALLVVMRLYEAVQALQAAADAASPASEAETAGKPQIVVLRAATVTAPGSSATFTADVYATGVAV